MNTCNFDLKLSQVLQFSKQCISILGSSAPCLGQEESTKRYRRVMPKNKIRKKATANKERAMPKKKKKKK